VVEDKTMSMTELQKQIKDSEGKIAGIQQSKSGFEQQLSVLRAEEQGLIVAARTGDDTAKARLVQIRSDVSVLEREIQDDASATSRIASEVDGFRASLSMEKRADARRKVLAEVNVFTERAKVSRNRIGALADELRATGQTCMAEAKELGRMLIDVDGADRALNAITLSTISVNQSIAQAAALLDAPPNSQLKALDCMAQMQRFITALEHLTFNIERESELVRA
jgi:chromosome segregation ATPase